MPRYGGKVGHWGDLAHGVRSGLFSLAGALLPVVVLAGCGAASGSSNSASNGSSGELVARVGATSIDRAELQHWANAIERGNSVATALGKISGTPRQKALEFLISSSWVLGEAREQGLSIPNGAIEHALQQRFNAAPDGRSEFEEEIASRGQTLADVKLEIKSALAAARLRHAVAKRVPSLTIGEVTRYYAHHRQSFYLPERRLVDLIEHIPGYGRAIALGKQLGPGARFARRANRELVHVESPAEAKERGNGPLVHMIFAATPGRVARPATFFGGWTIAVVRKIIPAEIQPLAVVRRELTKTLTKQRREQAIARFAAAFARKWTARTACSAAYVIQKCTQYRGALTRVNPLKGGGQ